MWWLHMEYYRIYVLKESGEGQFAEAMDKTTQNLFVITRFENFPD